MNTIVLALNKKWNVPMAEAFLHTSEKHKNRPIEKVLAEYYRWGLLSGGRNNKGWTQKTFRPKKRLVEWWMQYLKIKTLDDFKDTSDQVDDVIYRLREEGKANNTCRNFYESLKALCIWLVEKEYLKIDPVKKHSFDREGIIERRAMTIEEIVRIYQAAPIYHRKLLYETALFSGLREGELQNLTIHHLYDDGIRLGSNISKNRKKDFQLLPYALVKKLKEYASNKEAEKLYVKYSKNGNGKSRKVLPVKEPLLYVSSHPWRDFTDDLKRAGIPKVTPEGRLDFHSWRVAFSTFVDSAGASPKELQALMRHSDPKLTYSVYTKARDERLRFLVEKVYDSCGIGPENFTPTPDEESKLITFPA